MNKNIVLTGGTGFLGSHILKKLVENKYNVVVLVRKNSNKYRIQNISGKFEFFHVDENLDNLKELFVKYNIDTVIHTATEYGRNSSMSSILTTNLIFPIKLIEAGLENGLKYFINSDTFFGKEAFRNLAYLNEYTISKKYFLDYLLNVSGKIKIINMRLEHIFGELDSDNKFVTNILHKLINDEKEIPLTEGIQKRDFIYIDDVVDAYLIVLNYIIKIDSFTEFQIGRGESVSIREFVQILAEKSNSKSELKFGSVPNRIGEIQDSAANIVELERIGWKPKYDLEAAIIKMIELEIQLGK